MSDRLPTRDDLKKLSKRGMVCYALRCAMRVAHLTKPYPDVHEKTQACIDAVTCFCLATTDDDVHAAVNAAKAARAAVSDAVADATAVPNAVRFAATSAIHAAIHAVTRAVDVARVASAANAAVAAAHAAAATYAAVNAANADYKKLLELTGHQADKLGELGDPIDPGENGQLGSLWPNKKPDKPPQVREFLSNVGHCVKQIDQHHLSEPTKEKEKKETPVPVANDPNTLRYDEKHPNNHFPFLFVTANENEKAAFEKNFRIEGKNYIKGVPYFFGMFGNYKVAWFHLPSQGTANPDATLLCGEVIKEVSPVAVIMVGIAFGADEHTQKIGDVLVSKSILNYDSRKERGNTTEYKERPKEVGFLLFNAFSTNADQWEYPSTTNDRERFEVIPGAILTGSALIDDYKFRQKLLTDFAGDKPVGGEMEAYGIYAQCRLHNVGEWIIVKSICDWGHNKQNSQKEEWQKIAADSAVSFCHYIFSLRGHNDKRIFDDLLPQHLSLSHAMTALPTGGKPPH